MNAFSTQPETATATTPADRRQNEEPEDPVIKCAGLTKVFRDFWLRNRVRAVDDVNLSVQRGEVFGLLGPNGSGKSTTVKMILGLLHPTAGRIAVFGRHPRDVKMKQQLGYLPEESYLYPFLNARETLDYYAKLFHQDRGQRRRRIDMLLEMVGLDKVARRPIGEYSKGMQRRIGLAQALINDPQTLILDEPTTGLDPIGTHQIKDLIRQLAERGKTVLLCSHLLADVEDVTDRVAIMFGGKVRREGTIEQLLTQSGVTSIQTGDLSDADIEAVEAALAQRHKHIDRVEHPREKLESLFLQIVHSAQQEGAATSGAGSGGPIAGFLVEKESAHMPEAGDPGRVLSQLMRGEQAEPREGEHKNEGEGDARDQRAGGTAAGVQHEAASSVGETGEPSPGETRGGAPADEAETDRGVLDQLTGEGSDEADPSAAADQSHQPDADAAEPSTTSDQSVAESDRSTREPASTDEAARDADHSVIDSLVNPDEQSDADEPRSKPEQ